MEAYHYPCRRGRGPPIVVCRKTESAVSPALRHRLSNTFLIYVYSADYLEAPLLLTILWPDGFDDCRRENACRLHGTVLLRPVLAWGAYEVWDSTENIVE